MNLPRPLPEPPRVLRFTIEGEPVPAQMGAVFPDGRVAKQHPRVRSYKDRARLLTGLNVRRAQWSAGPEESFAVTLRAFVGTLRVIDCDNIAKLALDCLKHIAFPDDRQVMRLLVEKELDRERPRLEVEIERLGS